ncbi:DL-endopeptidase inhibitor IseA family protein [Niallia oryzisoli]|uniref:DL-endopeptidase inhibitor IseA family protein n=1 Tax=Niallia oryzisoli TaxID=1737571 RepID=A0ABZ2C7L8_9BACI
MKRKSRLLTFFIIGFSILLTGCGFLPEPSSLIQSPRMASAGMQNITSVAENYLPKGTVPVIANAPIGNQSILPSDFDGDGKMESVVLYQSLNNTRDVGAIVLKEKGGGFEKVFSRKGPGYEISYEATSDLTGDGHDELLIGWKIGNMAGNVLEIYTWENKEFKLIGKQNYHELEVIRLKGEKTYKLAVWQKEMNDIFDVKLLKWEKNQFEDDQASLPFYYPKVVEYYQKRSEAVPDQAQYWYYLADAHLKANHPGEALMAINQGMNNRIVVPSFHEFEELKNKIKIELLKGDAPVSYHLPEAGMNMSIPRELSPYLLIEEENGPSTNTIVSVYYTNDNKQKEKLFAVEVYSKEMLYEELPLQKIAESSQFVYYLTEGKANEAWKQSDSHYEKALLLREKMISTIVPESADPSYSSMEEKQVVDALTKAVNKYWYVTSGGNLEGAIESFLFNDLDYRYMGSELNSTKKLTAFLEESYTLDAINAYTKRAGIITHNGKLAQPNADGGSLLNYQKATVVAYQGNSNEKEFDLKVPLGTSLSYEYIHIEFQKTASGWKISSEPGTF